MGILRVGNAPCSWGTLEFEGAKGGQIGFARMLDELAATGYTGTELGDWGYMPTDPGILRGELQSRALTMLGAFVPVALKDPAAHASGLEDALRAARLLAAVAAEPKPYLVLADRNGTVAERTRNAGRITPPMGLSPEEWIQFAAGANLIARAVLRETGLRTVFHHHCAGYVETPEEIAHFLDATDPDAIGLVFDTGHYCYGSGGRNVIEGLERFRNRIWYIHFKDCHPKIAARARARQWDYFEALRNGVFCELGLGCVDFPAVLRWMRDTGYSGYALVEQDVLPGMGTPEESARRNREYLRSIESNYSAARGRASVGSGRIRVGIIGAGRIGRVHAATLAHHLPDALPAAIMDTNSEAARTLAREFGIPRVAETAEELLCAPDVDAVLICSSTGTHAGLVEQAARAGKHIFCEKPIDHSLEKIDRALAAVAKAGVKLQVGFNRRFDANFMRVRRAVESGEIGRPHLLHIVSRDPAPPPIAYVETSGGMFLDMTIHDFDMARFLIGDEVEEIYTAAAVRVNPEIGRAGDVDTAVILLRFRNGVIGTIDNSRKAVSGYDQRVEILGSEGSVATGNCFPNEAVISTASSVRHDLPLNFFMERYAESFVNELRAFVRAVRDDTPPPLNAADARVPVVLALAARKSYDEHRPVRLEPATALAQV
jgi:inositol 2-dehydrogenase